MRDRPNFLLIMTDQQRADHLGCYGNGIVRTPNIDGLAVRGARFDHCYVANPICMPNRASIMTGRMPSLHGVRSNGIPLDRRARTFVEELGENGYATALIGKAHLQNMTGLGREFVPPGAAGAIDADGSIREAERYDLEDPFYESENTQLWARDPDHKCTLPFYGFDHVSLATFHGDLVGGEYRRWLKERHPEADDLIGSENALPDNRIAVPQAWRTRVPEELYPSAFVAERTIDYLKNHVAAGRTEGSPFFIQCSFPDPHHPFTPPGRYWDMYDPDDIPLPPSFGKGASPILDHLWEVHRNGTADRFGQVPFAVTEREAREAIALTYGMISMIDDQVGRLLRCLEELGLAENTVVLFTSDHGDEMGDHGILLKGPLHYRGTTRVPMIWADPQGPSGVHSPALMSSIDIPATILARAGIAPYYGMQGHSLLPVLAGTGRGREAVLIEDDRERIYLNFTEPQRLRTIVTHRYRMTVYRPFEWVELFDLERDPLELENLWQDPDCSELRADITARLATLMIDMQDWTPTQTGRA